MTNKFDVLLATLLNEMTPAYAEYDPTAMGATVSQKISELPGKSQHWKYLQELTPEVRADIVEKVIRNVFTDNDDNTYSSNIDNISDLKQAVEECLESAET